MLTRRRRILWICLASGLLGGFFFYRWLSTGPIRRSALAAISACYDGHVELDSVSLRLHGGATLKGIRLHESSDPKSHVVCEIPRLELGGSLWGFLKGNFDPNAITLYGPRLRVAITETGAWSPRLPLRWPQKTGQKALPDIHIEDARLDVVPTDPAGTTTVRQIRAITLNVTEDAQLPSLRFSAGSRDPLWAAWKLDGILERATGHVRARLCAPAFALQAGHAEWLAAAWPGLWEELAPRGKLAVDAEFSASLAAPTELDYQILLDPAGMTLQVPTVPEKLSDLAGRIELTPRRVRLHTLVGRLGRAKLTASGEATLGQTPRFHLRVDVAQLALSQFAKAVSRDVASGDAAVTGTLDLLGTPDPQTWTGSFDGTLRDNQPETEPAELHLSIHDGALHLQDLEWPWAGGRARLSGVLPLQRDALARGVIELRGVSLDRAWSTDGDSTAQLAGTLDGTLQLAVPVHSWADSRLWSCHGPVRLNHVRLGDVEFDTLSGVADWQRGLLVLADASAQLDRWPLRGRIKLVTEPPYRLQADFFTDPIDLRQLTAQQPVEVEAADWSGQLSVSGSVSGTLSPLDIRVEGSASLKSLHVAGTPIGDATAKWKLAGRGFDIEAAELEAFGGLARFRGRYSWPAGDTPSRTGGRRGFSELRLTGALEDVDCSALRRAFSRAGPTVEGRASGAIEMTWGGADTEHGPSGLIVGHLESPRLRIGEISAATVAADFRSAGGQLEIPRWSAVLAAGSVSGSAKLTGTAGAKLLSASASSDELDLAELLRLGGASQPELNVRGRIATHAKVEIDLETGVVRGTGTAVCKSLILDGLPAIDSVTGQMEIRDQRIILRGFQASLWGGSAFGTLTFDRTGRPTPLIDVLLERVDRVELGRLAQTWPGVWSKSRGTVSGSGRFHFPDEATGRGIRGAGEYELASAVLASLPVSSAKGTLKAWDAPRSGSMKSAPAPGQTSAKELPTRQTVQIEVGRSSVAGGTARGQMVIGVARPVVYDCQFWFNDLDLATATRSAFGSAHAAAGLLSGDITLAGTSRGTADTRGKTHLHVEKASLWPVPVFSVLAKVLNLNLTKSGAFQTADGVATIENATLHFERVQLTSDAARLFGEGNVTLAGQVDMKVVGNVESGIPKNVPILGTIQKTLGYLQQRLVQIHLTGSLEQPTAVPVPLQDLTEPAINFFKGIVTGSLLDKEGRGAKSIMRQ